MKRATAPPTFETLNFALLCERYVGCAPRKRGCSAGRASNNTLPHSRHPPVKARVRFVRCTFSPRSPTAHSAAPARFEFPCPETDPGRLARSARPWTPKGLTCPRLPSPRLVRAPPRLPPGACAWVLRVVSLPYVGQLALGQSTSPWARLFALPLGAGDGVHLLTLFALHLDMVTPKKRSGHADKATLPGITQTVASHKEISKPWVAGTPPRAGAHQMGCSPKERRKPPLRVRLIANLAISEMR